MWTKIQIVDGIILPLSTRGHCCTIMYRTKSFSNDFGGKVYKKPFFLFVQNNPSSFGSCSMKSKLRLLQTRLCTSLNFLACAGETSRSKFSLWKVHPRFPSALSRFLDLCLDDGDFLLFFLRLCSLLRRSLRLCASSSSCEDDRSEYDRSEL